MGLLYGLAVVAVIAAFVVVMMPLRPQLTKSWNTWTDDEKDQAKISGKAMLYLVLAGVVLVKIPPVGGIDTIAALLALVLAVLAALAAVELPDSPEWLADVHEWLWYSEPVPATATAAGATATPVAEPLPRVRKYRRVAAVALAVTFVMAWVMVFSSSRLTAKAGEPSTPTTTDSQHQVAPGATSNTATSTTATTTPSTTAPPTASTTVYNCGAPALGYIPMPEIVDKPFSPSGVERCVSGAWQPWGSNPAPNTVRITYSAQDDKYFYAQFGYNGQPVLIRWSVAPPS